MKMYNTAERNLKAQINGKNTTNGLENSMLLSYLFSQN
jgi:hypothetical protein